MAALVLSAAHPSPAAAAVCAPLFRPVAQSAQPLRDPESLAPGDFTGDGRIDLAFSRIVAFEQRGTTGIGVLASRGSGTFGPPASDLIGIPGFNVSVAAGEFTGEGRLDLATVGEGTGLLVLVGDGRGGFTPRTVPGAADVTRALVVVDVNRDRHADVIAAGSLPDGSADLRVLLGDGAGGFVAQSPMRVGSDAGSAAAGDLNGDGSTDLVLGANASNFSSIVVLLGDGTGRFTALESPVAWRESRTSGGVFQLALADFNRDGRLDLAAGRANGPQLVLALGDGRGRFRQRARGWSTSNSYADSFAVGRFNRDRVPDIAVGAWRYDATGRSTWISVLQSDGAGGWREAPGSPYENLVGIGKLVAEDFDGNRFDDLVGVDAPTANSGRLHVLMNEGGHVSRGYRVPIREVSPAVRIRFPRTDGDLPADTSAAVIYGERVMFQASLTCEPSALRRRTFALYRRLAMASHGYGPWKRVAVRTTTRRGRVAAIGMPPMNAEYQWRPADHRRPLMRRGSVQALKVAPHITVHAKRIITGRVSPPRPGARIVFYASDGGGGDEEEWTPVGNSTIGPSGEFQHRALRRGVGYIAVLASNARYATGISPRFR
jgi:hypothetical protein